MNYINIIGIYIIAQKSYLLCGLNQRNLFINIHIVEHVLKNSKYYVLINFLIKKFSLFLCVVYSMKIIMVLMFAYVNIKYSTKQHHDGLNQIVEHVLKITQYYIFTDFAMIKLIRYIISNGIDAYNGLSNL